MANTVTRPDTIKNLKFDDLNQGDLFYSVSASDDVCMKCNASSYMARWSCVNLRTGYTFNLSDNHIVEKIKSVTITSE